MVLGEEIGVHLPHHVQSFLATLPGVAPALAAAFPALAIVAIGAAILEGSKKLAEWRQKMAQAKIALEEAGMGLAPLTTQIKLQNLQLQDQWRLLNGLPAQNGLKEAIIQAEMEAEKLNAELLKVLDTLSNKMKDVHIGQVREAFTGEKSTSDLEGSVNSYLDQIKQLNDALVLSQHERNAATTDDTKKALDAEVAANKKALNVRLDSLRQFTAQREAEIQKQKLDQLDDVSPEYRKYHPDTPRMLSTDPAQIAKVNAEFASQDQILRSLRQVLADYAAARAELATKGKLQDDIGDMNDRLSAQGRAIDISGLLHKQSQLAEAIREVGRAQKEQDGTLKVLTQDYINANTRAAEYARDAANALTALNEKAMQNALAEIAAQDQMTKTAARLAELQKEIDDAHAPLAKRLKDEAKELKDANAEVARRLALVQSLGAQTMGGMVGTDEQKAQYNKAVADYQTHKQKQLEIERKYDNDIAQTFRAQLHRQLIDWQNIHQQMGSFYMQTLGGINSSLASFIVTGQGNWRQLAETAIEGIVQIGLQWIESRIMMMILGGQQTGKTLAENAILAQSAAGLAGANAMASAALIDPFAAPEIAALDFGIAEGYAAFAAAERGALLPNRDMLVHTHPEEMILPQHISNFIVDAARGSSGSGDGRRMSDAPNINYSPVIMGNADEDKLRSHFKKALKSEFRRRGIRYN